MALIVAAEVMFSAIVVWTPWDHTEVSALPGIYWFGLVFTSLLAVIGYVLFDYYLAPDYNTRGSGIVMIGISLLGVVTAISSSSKDLWMGDSVLTAGWSIVAFVGGIWRTTRGARRSQRM